MHDVIFPVKPVDTVNIGSTRHDIFVFINRHQLHMFHNITCFTQIQEFLRQHRFVLRQVPACGVDQGQGIFSGLCLVETFHISIELHFDTACCQKYFFPILQYAICLIGLKPCIGCFFSDLHINAALRFYLCCHTQFYRIRITCTFSRHQAAFCQIQVIILVIYNSYLLSHIQFTICNINAVTVCPIIFGHSHIGQGKTAV